MELQSKINVTMISIKIYGRSGKIGRKKNQIMFWRVDGASVGVLPDLFTKLHTSSLEIIESDMNYRTPIKLIH